MVNMYTNKKSLEFCGNFTQESLDFGCPLIYSLNISFPCCRYVNAKIANPCNSDFCLYWNKNYWVWEKPGILSFFVFMLLQCLIQLLILFLYENGLLTELFYKLKNLFSKNNPTDNFLKEGDIAKDNNVIAEENDIANNLKEKLATEIFIVDRLKKYYSNFMAVRGISFSLKPNDCFGLLGKPKT